MSRAAASAAAIAAIPALTAAARPTRGSGVITLNLAVDWEGLPAMAANVPQIMAGILAHFEAEHPGTRVNAVAGDCSNSANYTAPDVASAIIGGNGFDVFSVCGQAASFVEQSLVMPLDSWLRRDNIPMSTWPADAVGFYTYGAQTYYLPSEIQPRVLVYNRSLLDSKGIVEPAPTWSYTEAADLWRSLAGEVGKQRRYGAMLPLPHSINTWAYVAKGFGGPLQDSTYTRATFSDPRVVAGGRWLIEDLVWRDAVARGSVYNHASQFLAGQVGFADAPVWSLSVIADNVRGVDWQFIPYPVFPAGPSTMDSGNAYGISAGTRQPELAWELLKWLCVEPEYWRYEVRVSLNTPAQAALWPEWEQVVLQVAPPLRGKGLHYYSEVVANGWGTSGHPFAYADDQATTIIGQWSAKAIAHQMSIADACSRIDQQINALEAVAGPQQARLTAQTAAVESQLLAMGHGSPKPFAAPAPAGIGTAAASAAARVTSVRGGYAIQGLGSGVGATSDSGTFAAEAATASQATYVCRLDSLAVSKGAHPLKGAAAGLMWRGDLSDDAAMGLLAVVVGQGVTLEWRQVPGEAMQSSAPASAAATSGLIGAGAILRTEGAGTGGLLLKPVWLKVVRNVATWTPYTSLDGKTWTQAGSAIVLQVAGAWVGLFAASAAPASNSKVGLQAGFSRVTGLGSTKAVALGSAG